MRELKSSWVAGLLPRQGMSECTRNWVAELALATLLGARFFDTRKQGRNGVSRPSQLSESRSNLRDNPDLDKSRGEEKILRSELDQVKTKLKYKLGS